MTALKDYRRECELALRTRILPQPIVDHRWQGHVSPTLFLGDRGSVPGRKGKEGGEHTLIKNPQWVAQPYPWTATNPPRELRPQPDAKAPSPQ